MLRPESQVGWSNGPGDADPRTSQLHDLGAYILVHLESSADLGKDGIADLRRQIADTRAADAQFSADQARVQANTVANAMDDTEADQAVQALLAMGVKAAPIVREVQKGANDAARERLQQVIDDIALPTIVK
jgi:CBS-domain-containing membrane protein